MIRKEFKEIVERNMKKWAGLNKALKEERYAKKLTMQRDVKRKQSNDA